MDDGNLTDGQGNVINFKNTIVICTSNAGFGNGTDQEYDDIMQEMKNSSVLNSLTASMVLWNSYT